MCTWVLNIYKYHEATIGYEPLMLTIQKKNLHFGVKELKGAAKRSYEDEFDDLSPEEKIQKA